MNPRITNWEVTCTNFTFSKTPPSDDTEVKVWTYKGSWNGFTFTLDYCRDSTWEVWCNGHFLKDGVEDPKAFVESRLNEIWGENSPESGESRQR